MIDLKKLAAELHEAAVAKGFWAVDDAVDKHIAKMHGELSEAVQEDRCGRPMLYVDDIEVSCAITDPAQFDGRKPEGVAAELADFVMMALDYFEEGDCMGLAARVVKAYAENMVTVTANATLYDLVNNLHKALVDTSDIDVGYVETMKAMAIMIDAPRVWLAHRGYDLYEIIRLKMAYNASRPKLHGRLY